MLGTKLGIRLGICSAIWIHFYIQRNSYMYIDGCICLHMSTYGCVWVHMAAYGRIWPHMGAYYGHTGLLQQQTESQCTYCARSGADVFAIYGCMWLHMAAYVRIFTHMHAYGRIWLHMDTYGYKTVSHRNSVCPLQG